MSGRFAGSIELRFVAATTIILALAIATVTFLHVQDMRAASREEAEADVTAGVRVQQEALQGELHKFAEDVKVLANTPPVAAIQRALANGGIDPESGESYDVWRDRLAEIFEAFLTAKRSYMQARYLDSSGTEIVRVDRRDGRVVRIPDGELQNKSGRGYSTKPRELLLGEIYVSPLDLSVEDGEIEVPRVRVIRFATPVHDPSGRFGGALVTNIFASGLLARIGAVERGAAYVIDAYIIDSTGQYLFHPDESRMLGSELGTGIDVAGDFGADAAAEMTAGAGTLTAAGQLLAYAPVDFAGLSTTNEWQMVRAVALAELPAPSLLQPIGAAVVSLLAGGAVAYLMANSLTRPIRLLRDTAVQIGHGDSDARAPVSGADEVGVLAREFNAMADAVADREARLQRQTIALEASNRELEAFSYSVSHDLRAPLRAIDGFSRAIDKDYGDRLDDEGRDLLGRVRHASRHMGELIDDLLKLASVTGSALEREPLDLTALAYEAVEELRESDDGRDVRRDVEMTVHGDLRALGDAHLVRVLLHSLLDNAWKFTRDRSPARIEVGVAKVNGEPAFYVRDNGAGFDMRYVDKLFRPFQRLHRQDEFEGTGIGLATVKRIVERHDGKAWAEGAVGEGATVFFTLEGGDDA